MDVLKQHLSVTVYNTHTAQVLTSPGTYITTYCTDTSRYWQLAVKILAVNQPRSIKPVTQALYAYTLWFTVCYVNIAVNVSMIHFTVVNYDAKFYISSLLSFYLLSLSGSQLQLSFVVTLVMVQASITLRLETVHNVRGCTASTQQQRTAIEAECVKLHATIT